MDIPRIFNITESAHRIHNPFTPEKLATLGAALRLEVGTRVLDLGSGSGEMLCTWARDYRIRGTGIDMSQLFSNQAKLRAEELDVRRSGRIHSWEMPPVTLPARRSAWQPVSAPRGSVEESPAPLSFWPRVSAQEGSSLSASHTGCECRPTEEVAKGCRARSISDFLLLPGLLASFDRLGYDVVEMVLANQDGWDRYEAAKWLTMRRWLEANPDDGLRERRSSRTDRGGRTLRRPTPVNTWAGACSR